jgi:poly(hydroxyalkanoate) depolymerase family esterase
MRGIPDTIARLAAAAKRSESDDRSTSQSLKALPIFGSNPGALDAYIHIPVGLGRDAPLVVVLHGCTQSAADYDAGSGWSQLADDHGFALLYPQQRRGNNMNRCFNWFEPGDTRGDAGEALSIRQMVATVQSAYAIDPRRIFITGLSAGGAMASVMLATYPEIFAGGAIIAGLPYGVANGMVQAFDRMRGHGLPAAKVLGDAVRVATSHGGPWPRISIWHGTSDGVVAPDNADAIARQWRALHGLGDRPDRIETVDSMPRRIWCAGDGAILVEEYRIPNMGHGTPVKVAGHNAYGKSGPYMLDVGISSTFRIAQFWDLLRSPDRRSDAQREPADVETLPALPTAKRLYGTRIAPPDRPSVAAGVKKIIEDALRSAGLMK